MINLANIKITEKSSSRLDGTITTAELVLSSYHFLDNLSLAAFTSPIKVKEEVRARVVRDILYHVYGDMIALIKELQHEALLHIEPQHQRRIIEICQKLDIIAKI